MAHAYLFRFYASKAPADYVPSLIGRPTLGAAQTAYYERVELDSVVPTAITKTHYVADDGTNEPILQVRVQGSKATLYIPKAELEEIAAENHDDATFKLLRGLFGARVF